MLGFLILAKNEGERVPKLKIMELTLYTIELNKKEAL